MNPLRSRPLSVRPLSNGPIIYWMHRNLRAHDNWGLLHAQHIAIQMRQPLCVVFCLAPSFLNAPYRHYDFMFKGLREISDTLDNYNIPFGMLYGDPATEMLRFSEHLQTGLVVTDFDPLRIKRLWTTEFATHSHCAVHEVDSRNIVPCWIASPKREFMARTIRPKIHARLQEFLDPFPPLRTHPFPLASAFQLTSVQDTEKLLRADTSIPPISWLPPGEQGAHQTLDTFLTTRLKKYHLRNDPNQSVCSDLSPYLHFGMLSAQRIVLKIMEHHLRGENIDAFVEELVVRRELSDNFCFYTPDYDATSGFPDWARATLDDHRHDARQNVYTQSDFEQARTHDPLWNAAQHQMTQTGKMHGYMRMYWAKKILEWSPNPEAAMQTAIDLNDRYSLDGRDTNGYTGIAWSIGGVHDRGWTERPIFGKIRYMNYQGARRKFDVDTYVHTWRCKPDFLNRKP